jgi:hypothetical protein
MTLVAAKNRATNTDLRANIGASALMTLVQNTTHPSLAWTTRLQAGSWHLTEPMVAQTVPINGGPLGPGTEVDTWATTDVVNTLTASNAWIVDVEPLHAALANSGMVTISHCTIPEDIPIGTQPGDDFMIVGNYVNLFENNIQRSISVNIGGNPSTGYLQINNNGIDGGFTGGYMAATSSQQFNPMNLIAGYVMPRPAGVGNGSIAFGNGVMVDGDIVLRQGVGDVGITGYVTGGFVNAQVGPVTVLSGMLDMHTLNNFGGNSVWGAAPVDAGPNGTVLYTATASVATFPTSGGLQIEGQSNVCCATLASPSVQNCNLSLTAATLAAGACSAVGPALGDRAFMPGGGAFKGAAL